MSDYRQIVWDDACREACRELVRMAMREDLGGGDLSADITTAALVPEGAPGAAIVAARKPGVIAGLPCVEVVLAGFDPRLRWEPLVADGTSVPGCRPNESPREATSLGETRPRADGTRSAPATIGRIAGPAGSLLTAERTLLNILGRLSGIATLTRRYVEATRGTRARIYDTRKTTPGWRLLEKYAVRVGGGHNHRLNLAEGVLIKDNHLALGADPRTGVRYSPGEAVRLAKRGRESSSPPDEQRTSSGAPLVEVEIDRLDQLADVLAAGPDIVLLDNMTVPDMREAVARRDQLAPHIELEASGGVDLTTVASIAQAGIDRISVGALTHAAVWLDIALDWQATSVP